MAANPYFGYNVLRDLANQKILTPYLESRMLSDEWPDSYTIKVDSSPYTGTGDGWFHPSGHCLEGERLLYYIVHPFYKDRLVEERRTITGAMTLAMGSALHAVVQTKFLLAGLITENDIEVTLQNDAVRGRGHMDFRIHHPNKKKYGVELKTMNSNAFDFLKEARDYQIAQLQCYLDWAGLTHGIVLILESGYPYRFKEFEIRRDDKLLKTIYDKWERVVEAVNENKPPKHCCALGSQTMKNCPARYHCWLSDEKVRS